MARFEFIDSVRRLRPSLLATMFWFAFLTAVLEVLSIWMLRSLMLILAGRTGAWSSFVPLSLGLPRHPESDFLIESLAAGFLFFTIKNLVLAYLWHLILSVFAKEQVQLSQQILEHYLRLPLTAQLEKTKIGMVHNVSAIRTYFADFLMPLLTITTDALIVIGLVLLVAKRSPLTTVTLAAAMCAIAVFFRVRSANVLRSLSVRRRRHTRELSRTIQNSLTDPKSVKVSGLESYFLQRSDYLSKSCVRDILSERTIRQVPSYFVEPFIILMLLAFVFVLHRTGAGEPDLLGNLALYFLVALRVMPALQRISVQMHTLSVFRPEREQVARDLLEPVERLPDRARGALRPPFKEVLKLDHVSLAYKNDEQVLKDISLSILPGEKLAIKGPSGAGKTSLVNVMLGLIPPNSGHITLDGREEPLLYTFRSSAVSYVPQEIFVLGGTIAENVTVGTAQKDVDESLIWRVLDDVGLSITVRSRGGLSTRIGEAGSKLSGGERQRLGIARALYSGPHLLVLDEATSQLDGETEDWVLQRIIARGRSLTLISVTHRPATLSLFDRIIHLEGGSISMETFPR